MFGAFPFGTGYFGQAFPFPGDIVLVPPVPPVLFDLCDATVESLVPMRLSASLNPGRYARSLVPVRSTEVIC